MRIRTTRAEGLRRGAQDDRVPAGRSPPATTTATVSMRRRVVSARVQEWLDAVERSIRAEEGEEPVELPTFDYVEPVAAVEASADGTVWWRWPESGRGRGVRAIDRTSEREVV